MVRQKKAATLLVVWPSAIMIGRCQTWGKSTWHWVGARSICPWLLSIASLYNQRCNYVLTNSPCCRCLQHRTELQVRNQCQALNDVHHNENDVTKVSSSHIMTLKSSQPHLHLTVINNKLEGVSASVQVSAVNAWNVCLRSRNTLL